MVKNTYVFKLHRILCCVLIMYLFNTYTLTNILGEDFKYLIILHYYFLIIIYFYYYCEKYREYNAMCMVSSNTMLYICYLKSIVYRFRNLKTIIIIINNISMSSLYRRSIDSFICFNSTWL